MNVQQDKTQEAQPAVLPAGSLLILEADEISGCGSSNGPHTVLRKLHEPLDLSQQPGSGASSVQVSAEAISWRDLFQSGSVKLDVDNVMSMHPDRAHNPFDPQRNATFHPMRVGGGVAKAMVVKEGPSAVPQNSKESWIHKIGSLLFPGHSEHKPTLGGAKFQVYKPTGSSSSSTQFAMGWNADQSATSALVNPIRLMSTKYDPKFKEPGVTASASLELDCVNCYIGMNLGVTVEIGWNMNRGQEASNYHKVLANFGASMNLGLKAQIQAQGGIDLEKLLGTVPLLRNVLLFTIGPVPVLLGLDFSLKGNIKAQFTGQGSVELGYKAEYSIARGIEHHHGQAPTSLSQPGKFVTTPMKPQYSLNADLTAEAGLSALLALNIDHLCSFNLVVAPMVSVEAKFDRFHPVCQLAIRTSDPVASVQASAVLHSSIEAALIQVDWKFIHFHLGSPKSWKFRDVGPRQLLSKCIPLGSTRTGAGQPPASNRPVLIDSPVPGQRAGANLAEAELDEAGGGDDQWNADFERAMQSEFSVQKQAREEENDSEVAEEEMEQ